jgi:hypothetical protein
MARLLLALWGGWVMLCPFSATAWGFFAHERINGLAVNLLPPGLQALFRSQQTYLIRHATDPDKRRYAVKEEGPRHYIDLDRYGTYPFDSLPREWKQAVARFTEDTLQQHGIVPWWMEVMTGRLIKAFREKDIPRILQNAAEIGHYLSDAHVPLHTCRNHNGQFSGQRGIHGLWESRIPELLADGKWNFWIGQAAFIEDMPAYWWLRLLESSLAADSVLRIEKELDARTDPSEKYAYEERKGKLVRQYSTRYTKQYDSLMNGMVERRMRLSVQSVASIWFTCWVLAGQPDLPSSPQQREDPEQREMIRQLDRQWRLKRVNGSEHL